MPQDKTWKEMYRERQLLESGIPDIFSHFLKIIIIVLHVYWNKFDLNKYKSYCSEHPALSCRLGILFLGSHPSSFCWSETPAIATEVMHSGKLRLRSDVSHWHWGHGQKLSSNQWNPQVAMGSSPQDIVGDLSRALSSPSTNCLPHF